MPGLRPLLLLPLLLASAAAVAQSEPERPRLLALPLENLGVDGAAVELLDGRIASAMERAVAFDVVTAADVRLMVEVEAQKQLLSCDSDACLDEIVDALGARHVLYGRIGRIEGAYILQLSLIDVQSARVIGRREVTATTLLALGDDIPGAVVELARAARVGPAPIITAALLPQQTR